MNAPDYFTCGEAATATGMSAQGLRAAIRRGDVAAEWHGSRWLLTRATVEQLTGAQRAADHTEGETT